MGIIQPCPACGSTEREIATLRVFCNECGFGCTTEQWQRLSQAARLLAAVEGLEQRLRTGDTETGYAALSATVDYANAGMLAGFAQGTEALLTYTEQGGGSLADALIVLGEAVK